jgi:hypothetical protein
VSPVPGIAPTSGDIDALSLEVEASGRLHAQVAPGRRNLRVQHAGQEAIYCVDLRPCETLTVTVHGAKLAHHASVSPGECP